jgi:hypothetical protein
MWGTLSDKRIGCYLHVQLLLRLARAVTFGPRSRRTHDHILLSHFKIFYIEDKVLEFLSPNSRVAQIYPNELGSFFLLLRLVGLR